MSELWPPQKNAITRITDALVDGHRRICLALPTGGGKSRIACELVRDWLICGMKVSLYTNRKMLLEQLSKVAQNFGLDHGVRSASAIEHGQMPTNDPLQISSVQTELSRTLRKKIWNIHPAERIVIDEAHINSGDTVQQLLDLHLQTPGAACVGLTATPLDLGHLYDHLIVAGTNSELRDCGALVLAKHYGCEEPDTSKIKKSTVELTENMIKKIFNVQHIVDHVFNRFEELNPEHKPTILFAPGVAESVWFADQFRERGIEAAHIDGQMCMYKGERYDADPDVRREIMRAWKAGEVKVVCNRFVLREGIDCPFISHMILATIFASLQSYIQSVGRGLRAAPDKTHLVIQDHGGHWWRHGSVNVNREWELEFTERMVAGEREERLRSGKDKEPMRCPQCGIIVLSMKCSCGYEIKKRMRPVIMTDGKLKEHTGELFRQRFVRSHPEARELWAKMYFRSMNTDRTFKAALGLFCHENGYYPAPTFPFMPTTERDVMRRVKDVPRDRLT